MITGAVLARNEASNIVACLQTLGRFVDEMILIDMESSDETVSLAAPHVDRIIPHPYQEAFDSARNVVIPFAKYDWLWFLDADERVPDATGKMVRDLIAQRADEFEALLIPFRTYFAGKWIQHSGWWPGYTMPRVLKRGHFRFATEVHGGVELSGRQLATPADPELAIEHHSYRDISHYLEKFNRYTSLESTKLTPDAFRWEDGVRQMVRDLWGYYERNEGILDGMHGWILAWLAGQYRWFSHAKLLDRDRESASQQAPPPAIDDVIREMQQELLRIRQGESQDKLALRIHSPIADPSGYAEEARFFIEAMARGDRHIQIDEIRWNDIIAEVPPRVAALMKSLQRTEPTGVYVAITNMIPVLAQPDPKAAYNILRTTFETDRIPAGWLPHFEGFDEVWVYAETTRQAFIRGGAPGEKLRVVPTGVDVETFCPEGPKAQLPECLDGCFVFLSVFDWQARKGWDCLLRAYCHEFAAAENVGLYLKVTRNHGHTLAQVRAQADAILQKYQGSLQSRPKIYIDDSLLSTQDLAALYRTVDAFVLPSRGEGWGLPWLEAMASGLPTIATEGSANTEYMTHANSLLVPARLVPVASAATAEIPIYKGHKWLEPEHDLLRSAMRRAVRDQGDMETTACRARSDIVEKFAFESVLSRTEAALADCERRIAGESPVEAKDAVRVQLEGELFASHSFANINETIVKEFQSEPNAAFRVDRVINQPTHDIRSAHWHELKNTLQLPRHDAPQVTIRHAFPPNFSRPETGKWVHIQPWEFGVLPIEWVGPLRDDVDEVWAPSQYVRDVYVRSGVPPEKIQVISWGVDESVYHPDGEALVLPGVGEDTFVFLFMGGAIARKGFDLVVDAFFAEFSAEEDVCLVVKDLGSNTFYRDSPSRSQLGERSNAPDAPQAIYLDHDMSAGQRASLYRASKCLVAPYRGEGFGLHVLEAMACGVAPIVPQGGPTDEFVTPKDGWHIEAEVVECHHDWRMCGIPTELSPSLDELKQAMRSAFSDPNVCQNKGKAASERVRRDMTWRASTQQMLVRCHELARRPDAVDAPIARPPTLTTIVVSDGEPIPLIESLARSEPFSDELMVVIQQPTDELLEICREHHARVYVASGSVNNRRNVGMLKSTSEWLLILDSGQFVADTSFEILRSRLATMTADAPIGVLLSRHGADRGFGWREARLIRNHNRLVHQGPNQLDAWFSLLKQERIADLSHIELSSQTAVSSEWAATDDADPFWTGANHHRSGDYFHAECYLHDALNQLPADSVFSAEARRMLFDTLLKIGDPYRAQEHLAVARVHHANDPMWAPLLAEAPR